MASALKRALWQPGLTRRSLFMQKERKAGSRCYSKHTCVGRLKDSTRIESPLSNLRPPRTYEPYMQYFRTVDLANLPKAGFGSSMLIPPPHFNSEDL